MEATDMVESIFNQRLSAQGRTPLSMSLEVTERCNLNCQHCYINLPANHTAARQRELSTAECKRLFDELAAAGTLWLLLTGGELMLRRDFEEIYLYARNAGFILTIYTNGTMITPRRADFLAQYPPYELEITVYGATAETYETVTRVPGSFAKCMEGLRLLHERGLPVKLKTVLLTLNSHELLAMKAIADGYGWEFRYDGMIHPRLNGDRAPSWSPSISSISAAPRRSRITAPAFWATRPRAATAP
jgi:MoaA/NifB/PqqE/SkfB family radical SAM enzyme